MSSSHQRKSLIIHIPTSIEHTGFFYHTALTRCFGRSTHEILSPPLPLKLVKSFSATHASSTQADAHRARLVHGSTGARWRAWLRVRRHLSGRSSGLAAGRNQLLLMVDALLLLLHQLLLQLELLRLEGLQLRGETGIGAHALYAHATHRHTESTKTPPSIFMHNLWRQTSCVHYMPNTIILILH